MMIYDTLDRLLTVGAGTAQGGNAAFSYDPLDNLRSLQQGTRSIRHVYASGNRLTGITNAAGVTQFTTGYDERGNQTRRFHAATEDEYTFDDANRLTATILGIDSATGTGGTATTYLYDGHGRRVRETSGQSTFHAYGLSGQLLYKDERKPAGPVGKTAFIQLAGSLVAERFVPAGGSAVVTYQHTDALGTPVATTDQNGAVIRRNRQKPPMANRPMARGSVASATPGMSSMRGRSSFTCSSAITIRRSGGSCRSILSKPIRTSKRALVDTAMRTAIH